MMYDIVVFLNSVFVRPHLNEKPVFSKIFTLGNVFKNLRFGGPKTPFTCEQKAVKWRKNIRFQTSPDTCGWALSLCLLVCFFFRCAFCQVDDIFTEYESRIFGHQGMKGVDDNK